MWTLGIGFALLLACVGGAFYFLRNEMKRMGASEEKEEQTYRKLKGVKTANEAKDEINKTSNNDVRSQLRGWMRDE